VDQTGTLQQAIDSAARIAGLGADYHVEYSERELSPIETFVLKLVGNNASRLGLTRHADAWVNSGLFESVLNDLRLLASAGDGFTLAAHCLCAAP
jgi:protease-4